MHDQTGNIKSQIEHLRGGMLTLEGTTDTAIKAAMVEMEKALYGLEMALNKSEAGMLRPRLRH